MTTAHGRKRVDQVVVLARGRGVRMGQPKAGLELPGDDRPFLSRILDLYEEAGLPVIVVTYPGGHPSCLQAAGGRKMILVEGPDSGDTALTMLIARRQVTSELGEVTHWWAHPVDVPLVTEKTLKSLLSVSLGAPNRTVRPVHREQVGHPVIIPDAVLEDLEKNQDWQTAPFRHFLEQRVTSGQDAPVLTVAVPDQGVTQDFDQPADLANWSPGPPPEDERYE